MARQSRTRLVPPKPELENQSLDTAEEPEEELVLTELDPVEQREELDLETECPRCHEIMELQSSFDKLMYCCDSCSFILKCV
jgi:phage FluMu protein Com